jgi:flagellar hook-associated protein 1 FlgK
MGNNVFGIAVSGLRAAQVGLATTGQNIANASTPGYSRQTIQQAAFDPLPTGGGFLGRGVQVTSIQRVYSDFLTRQVQTAQAQDGYLSNLENRLSELDNLLADPSAGFSPSLQDFYKGVQTVANDPKSVPARQSLLGLAQAMITRLQTVGGRMAQMREDVNTELKSTVNAINSLTSQIADLNDKIVIATGQAGGQPPNDLLDQRDQLVRELNKYVKSTVVIQQDGSYNIFIGNGQNLIVGTQAFTLGAVPAKDDPQRLDVAYQQFGVTAVIPSQLITGGSLGGVLQFRTDVLDQAQNALGRVAMSLAQLTNAQHRAGQDLNGQSGTNFFGFPMEQTHSVYNIPTGTPLGTGPARTLTATINTTSTSFTPDDYALTLNASGNAIITRLSDGAQATDSANNILTASGFTAFGVTFRLNGALTPNPPGVNQQIGISFLPAASKVVPNADNKGTARLDVAIQNTNALTTSDYDFIYDGPDYRVVRRSDGNTTNITAAAFNQPPVIVDGLQFSVPSGTLQPGDRFLVQPTRDFADNLKVAITDTAKIAAAAPIRATSDVLNLTVTASPSNTGAGGINITGLASVLPAQSAASAQRVDIVFTSATTFDIRDASTGAPIVTNKTYAGPSQSVSLNGWTVNITGTPAAGDRFTVDPRRNGGNASISVGSANGAPQDVNLRMPVAIRFNTPANTYDLVNPSNGAVLTNPQTGAAMSGLAYNTGTDISFNGWTVQISGAPAPGDVFMVQGNTNGVSDNRNMLAIGALQTQNTMIGTTTTFQGAYSKLVSDVGVQANQAKINQEAQAALLKQAETRREANSGVNLDEEASNLLVFQQAYLASSRTIQIAQRAFEEVLNIGR